MAADLLYKSLLGLCLIMLRAAKAGPKQHSVYVYTTIYDDVEEILNCDDISNNVLQLCQMKEAIHFVNVRFVPEHEMFLLQIISREV